MTTPACPFCGFLTLTVLYVPDTIMGLKHARCPQCGATGPWADSHESALARMDAGKAGLVEALRTIADWTMHSGTTAYEDGQRDPCGYYNHAYYLMEKEITAARDICKAALAAAAPGGK